MAGLSQEDLAERVDVSRQTVVNIETGRHRPSVDLAMRLADALHFPIEVLFPLSRKT
jgi:putative transcriptional regulator